MSNEFSVATYNILHLSDFKKKNSCCSILPHVFRLMRYAQQLRPGTNPGGRARNVLCKLSTRLKWGGRVESLNLLVCGFLSFQQVNINGVIYLSYC